MDDGSIDLDAVGEHFRFRRTDAFGKVQEILLSDNDVLQLATSALNLQGMVLRRQRKASPRDLVVMNVAQVGVGVHPENGNLHLKMIDPSGVSVAFAIPLPVAKQMSEVVARRLPELEEKIAERKAAGAAKA
jgi:hypothetical protein